ncbi:MAG: hypothetical protein QUS33_01435, partial [Dehalococcoidia bacterium]|nr:hypothetical protein [Dehalococcoidia bacterium]
MVGYRWIAVLIRMARDPGRTQRPLTLPSPRSTGARGEEGRLPRKLAVPVLIGLAVSLLTATAAQAVDSGSCLNCHKYRGLARIADDGKTVSHFYVDPSYYKRGLGPHARLDCTDCHEFSEVKPCLLYTSPSPRDS